MKAFTFNPRTEPERACEFLAPQPPKVRQWVMAHIPEMERDAAFQGALRCSSHACIIYEGGTPVALGWLVPAGPHARTAWAHFILPPMPRPLPVAGLLIDEAFRFYDALACLVPTPLRAVRRILNLLNFERLTTLPEACYIATHRQLVDGVLYVRKKNV